MIAPHSPMRAKGLTPKPAMLAASYVWCPTHATGGPKGWRCAACAYLPATAESATTTKTHSRPGAKSEDALYAALDAAGYLDLRWMERNAPDGSWVYADLDRIYQRGYPWGLYLTPRRGFQADAAFPRANLLVEVEGGAHGVQKMRKHDVLRRQLAESAGWRVLSVLPEQVRDGSAVELVRRAIETAAARGTKEGT